MQPNNLNQSTLYIQELAVQECHFSECCIIASLVPYQFQCLNLLGRTLGSNFSHDFFFPGTQKLLVLETGRHFSDVSCNVCRGLPKLLKWGFGLHKISSLYISGLGFLPTPVFFCHCELAVIRSMSGLFLDYELFCFHFISVKTEMSGTD